MKALQRSLFLWTALKCVHTLLCHVLTYFRWLWQGSLWWRCVAEMLMVTQTISSLFFHHCWWCSSVLRRMLSLSQLHSLLLGIKMTTKPCKWLSCIQQLADAEQLGSVIIDIRALFLSVRWSFVEASSTWFGLCSHVESSNARMLSTCLEQLIPRCIRDFNVFFSEA